MVGTFASSQTDTGRFRSCVRSSLRSPQPASYWKTWNTSFCHNGPTLMSLLSAVLMIARQQLPEGAGASERFRSRSEYPKGSEAYALDMIDYAKQAHRVDLDWSDARACTQLHGAMLGSRLLVDANRKFTVR